MSYAITKKALFSLDPHAAHELALSALSAVDGSSLLRKLVAPSANAIDPRLAVETLGLRFSHPLGLAAGFDKNARAPRALAALGFSHLEIGTVTAQAQDENPRPNMFRLPDDRALVNRLGFPNEGAETVTKRLVAKGCSVPVGISIGKSRVVPLEPIEGAVEDYVASFRLAKKALASLTGFVVVNVSSPNTKDLRAMQGAEIARLLLNAIQAENQDDARVPILLKVAPDLDDAALEELLAVVEETKLDGVVATNTTIARKELKTPADRIESIGAGGLSGPPVHARALEVVRRTRKRLGPAPTIIGVGGISNAEHALAMLRAGADLLQLYTGFVYGGPYVAVTIAREIAAEIDRAGVKTLAELVR
ncbi:MAG TPA: quinone-dependent dihydroorotate dehydrogenase [Polyangiaceae bacterium]